MFIHDHPQVADWYLSSEQQLEEGEKQVLRAASGLPVCHEFSQAWWSQVREEQEGQQPQPNKTS